MILPRASATPPAFHMDAALEGRANLLARSIERANTTAVVFTTTPALLGTALGRAMPGLRVLTLEGPAEAAEWDLRLAELMAGVHRVAALDMRLLWDSRLVFALRRWAPRTACIELAGIGSAGLYEPWAVNLLFQRVRDVLPGATMALVSVPEGAYARGWLERLVGATAAAHDMIVPPGVALRVTRVGAERQRWSELLRVTAARDAPVVVVTPSRARAVAAAARLGSAAMAYHGGLLESERATALDAFRRRNLHALVTTQLLPPFDGLPAPGAIVLTHPPHRCEIVPRLAAWLARATVPGALYVLWNTQDAAAERGGGLGVRPNLADLRAAFRTMRALSRDGYVRIVPESLAEAAGRPAGQPYLAATCLAALEAAGYLGREDDIGRLATVTVLTRDPAPAAARALPPWQVGTPMTLDPLVAALQRGLEPTEWQQTLLEAALDGILVYRPAGQERLYKLLHPDRGAASRLQLMVQERANVVANDQRAVARWFAAPACRVRALALVLSMPPEPKCGLCDHCAPRVDDRAPEGGEPWHIALRALAEIPLAVPERAAARIARQALSGAGLEEGSGRSGALIELLVQQGLVRRETGDLQPRLIVTDEGWARLAGK